MNELVIREFSSEIERVINFYNIDPELFKEKLADRLLFTNLDNIRDKRQYLLAIIRKMIVDEKLKDTRKIKKDGVTLLDIVDRARRLGITITPNEVYLLDLYFSEIVKYLNPNQIKIWVNASLSYLINNKNVRFVDLFKRSKTIKDLHLNYEEIEKTYCESMYKDI